jgi:NAD(P)-dependent dehydrogenase (short-subunit alcohol dehydrogenase family)
MNDRPVALITGAARRLGRAIAMRLAESGHDIALHYNTSEQSAFETAGDLVGMDCRTWCFQADLQSEDAPRQLIERTSRECERLDVLVNNAAVFERHPFESLDTGNVRTSIEVNLVAPVMLIRHASPILSRHKGVVINMTDALIRSPRGGLLEYGMAKAGLEYVTQALARSLAPDVRVNAVAPGIVAVDGAPDDDVPTAVLDRIPTSQPATPQDVAAAVQFLVESSQITGEILSVDGGLSLT